MNVTYKLAAAILAAIIVFTGIVGYTSSDTQRDFDLWNDLSPVEKNKYAKQQAPGKPIDLETAIKKYDIAAERLKEAEALVESTRDNYSAAKKRYSEYVANDPFTAFEANSSHTPAWETPEFLNTPAEGKAQGVLLHDIQDFVNSELKLK